MTHTNGAKICKQCNDVFALYMFKTNEAGTLLSICNKCLRTNKRKKYHNNNPKKTGALAMVTIALKSGHLQKQPCEQCGDLNSEAHHPDYDKPLKVIWLCHLHHMQLHHKRS